MIYTMLYVCLFGLPLIIMEEYSEIQIILQTPYQFMVGLEFYPEEEKDGKVYRNEFSIHLLLISIKFSW